VYVTTVPFVIIEIKTDSHDPTIAVWNERQTRTVGDSIRLAVLSDGIERFRSQGAGSIGTDRALRVLLPIDPTRTVALPFGIHDANGVGFAMRQEPLE
jgi:hypothetical protein